LTNEVKNSSIAVLDQSKDAATTSLIAQIDASNYFDVHQNLVSYQEVEKVFKQGRSN
jgi:ABC-2 type transport system permease protein